MALSRFTSDLSSEQLLQTVNERLEASISSMNDMVRREVRAANQGPSEPAVDSLLALVSPTFLLKALCVGGVLYGALRYFGYTWRDIQLVSKGSMRRTVCGVEDRIRALQKRMDVRFQELAASVAQYKAELDAMRRDTTAAAGQVRGNMEHFAGQVHAMSESTQLLDAKMGKTEQGVRLLCTIVADNSPNSQAQLGLRSYAREGLLTAPAPPLDAASAAPLPASQTVAATSPGGLLGLRSASLRLPGKLPSRAFPPVSQSATFADVQQGPQRSTSLDGHARLPPFPPQHQPFHATAFSRPFPSTLPSSISCPEAIHGGAVPERPGDRRGQGSPLSGAGSSPPADSPLKGVLADTDVSSSADE